MKIIKWIEAGNDCIALDEYSNVCGIIMAINDVSYRNGVERLKTAHKTLHEGGEPKSDYIKR